MNTFRRIAACLLLAVIVIGVSTTGAGAVKLTTEVPPLRIGDADGDGVITIMDATVIQRYLASLPIPNRAITERCGSISTSTISILDATLIQRYIAGFNVPYDIGAPIT